MVFKKPYEETLEEVAQIIDWYYDKSSEASIDDLADKRDKLASLVAYLSEYTAKAGMLKSLAYINRKYLTSVRTRDYTEMEGISATLAEKKATVDSKKELEDEKKKEAEAERLYMLVRASGNVLQAMQQRISLLSKEKEANRDQAIFDRKLADIEKHYDTLLSTQQEELDNLGVKYKRLVGRLAQVLPPK